jgi:hypothetical protein
LNLKAHNLQFFYKIRKILRNLQKKKKFWRKRSLFRFLLKTNKTTEVWRPSHPWKANYLDTISIKWDERSQYRSKLLSSCNQNSLEQPSFKRDIDRNSRKFVLNNISVWKWSRINKLRVKFKKKIDGFKIRFDKVDQIQGQGIYMSMFWLLRLNIKMKV